MVPFFQQIIERASRNIKTIVHAEGSDERTIEAAADVFRQKFARLVVLGTEDQVMPHFKKYGLNPQDVNWIDHRTDARRESFAQGLYELRKEKGMTLEQARTALEDEVYFGMMLLKTGVADGLVAGAVHATADVLRPALQIIKAAPGIKTVSSMFFMCWPDNVLLYADCGLLEDPNANQLADIAVSTARTGIQFGFEPRVAMLSYSTKGSAAGPNAQKVERATARAKEAIHAAFGDRVQVDGELQFDAAVVPAIAERKAPGSPIQGQANTFIFPDLGAGNICYKMTQRLAGAEAFGPIVQGLAMPVNDLSRGCTALDIVATVAITAIQATA